ncbi:cell death activator CIDE-3-like protein [Labeo rohita]|uniref:Cell death activator CIDE-3-like protein n=1 Tax=Labeo rohita TaxID=84645 RepID=A0A498N8F2_LABRO|nr:cell death activator CIDE-3-like protein [Labeo rohita]
MTKYSCCQVEQRCISACGSVTQQLLPRWPQHSRPFRVVNSDHSVKKGIMVNNLEDLRNKVMDVFHMHCVSAFVLDEDGTGVDTEDFFQTLKENTVIMVLGEGQKWAPQQCYKAKRMLREVLKWTLFTMQTTGHILVGTSCYIQHLIDEDEKTEAQLISPACFIKELQH